jgi:hypothetical protein
MNKVGRSGLGPFRTILGRYLVSTLFAKPFGMDQGGVDAVLDDTFGNLINLRLE